MKITYLHSLPTCLSIKIRYFQKNVPHKNVSTQIKHVQTIMSPCPQLMPSTNSFKRSYKLWRGRWSNPLDHAKIKIWITIRYVRQLYKIIYTPTCPLVVWICLLHRVRLMSKKIIAPETSPVFSKLCHIVF